MTDLSSPPYTPAHASTYCPALTPHLVALDIDGTTITHAGELRPAVQAAVRAVADAGHHVTIATGRTINGTLPILAALGIERGFAVCCNGALTVRLDPDLADGYEVVDEVTFDPGPVLDLLEGSWPDATVAVEDGAGGFKVSAPFPDGDLLGKVTVVPWADLKTHPVTRVCFYSPSGSAEDFIKLTQAIGLHGVNYAVGFSAWLDISPEGVSKASALEIIRRDLRVEPMHTIAIGDQRNDVEMLHWAARGVAMGNAPDEVKAIADEVTGSVDEDGLAAVLRTLPGV
ncbi:MAG: HAD hydrolase family protein [Tetrasphaera sp.]|nr:HAD hydrolase family protein [Tetrasphaera sp.]